MSEMGQAEWTKTRMLERYAHLSPSHLVNAVNHLDEAIPPQNSPHAKTASF